MNEITPILDRISGYLFLTGLITSKLKKIPNNLLSACLNVASLAAYFTGYVAWYIAALFYPNHPRKQESWYGFIQFKHQFQASALLGTLATIICILFPPLIIPATWIYCVSNLLWSIGEYHKKAKPPQRDGNYSSAKQAVYFRYTVFVTVASAIAALAASAVVIYPSAAIYIIFCSSILAAGFTIVALLYLAKCTFCHFPTDTIEHSYDILCNQLSIASNNVTGPTNSQVLEQEHPTNRTGRFFDTDTEAHNDLCEEEQDYVKTCHQ